MMAEFGQQIAPDDNLGDNSGVNEEVLINNLNEVHKQSEF
jgi:hypothetical protein